MAQPTKALTDRIRFSISFFVADKINDSMKAKGTGSWAFTAASIMAAMTCAALETKLTKWLKHEDMRWAAVFLESFSTCTSIITYLCASLIVSMFAQTWVQMTSLQSISVTWIAIVMISVGTQWLIPPPQKDDESIGAKPQTKKTIAGW